MRRRRTLTLADLSGDQTARVAELTLDVIAKLLALRGRKAIEALTQVNPIIQRQLKRASREA